MQKADELNCAGDRPKADLLAGKFSTALEKADPNHQSIRVAVGDSFAPFFLSRLMWDANKDPGLRWLHKEQYEFSPTKRAWVPNSDDKALSSRG